MFTHHSPFVVELARDQYDRLLQAAARERLCNVAAAARPGAWQRLRWSVGDFLIGMGARLKA